MKFEVLSNKQVVLIIQLVGTLGILLGVQSTEIKAILLPIWWFITFYPLSKAETVFFVLISTFFTIMNYVTLRQEFFVFTEQDILLMPYYELFMWGFYLLHTTRILDGPAPENYPKIIWPLAVLYAAAFALFKDSAVLLLISVGTLVVAFYFFRDKYDFIYAGYMLLVGIIIEYTGVYTGKWFYPEEPITGVPLVVLFLWALIGLFHRRLIMPILVHYGYNSAYN